MNTLNTVMLLVLVLFFIEVILRLSGNKPHGVQKRSDFNIEPGGKYTRAHPALGYSHLPGRFRVTISNPPHSFTATHLENTLRVTHPIESYSTNGVKDELWVFGCSFTYGWLVDDNQTYPWLLQKSLPEYEVINFGCIGYGTVHMLIQLENALREGKKPKAVILAYGHFHDERNTFSRNRRKTLLSWSNLGPLVQPYAKIKSDGSLDILMADVLYIKWPLSDRSALIHYLEKKYNKLEERLSKKHKVTKAIIEKIRKMCSEMGVVLIVSGITDSPETRDMLEHCRSAGIKTVDISLKADDKESIHSCGSHPSPAGHEKYAERLSSYIKTVIK